MAKILYGIAGEGMGHATRSLPIIEELSKKHNVVVATSSRAFEYIKKHHDNTIKIDYFGFFLREQLYKQPQDIPDKFQAPPFIY
jgi:uncharacterized protein (TIGR00661 family)